MPKYTPTPEELDELTLPKHNWLVLPIEVKGRRIEVTEKRVVIPILTDTAGVSSLELELSGDLKGDLTHALSHYVGAPANERTLESMRNNVRALLNAYSRIDNSSLNFIVCASLGAALSEGLMHMTENRFTQEASKPGCIASAIAEAHGANYYFLVYDEER